MGKIWKPLKKSDLKALRGGDSGDAGSSGAEATSDGTSAAAPPPAPKEL